MDRKKIGSIGEELAKATLEFKGYTILETNFRCKLGEIDIIAKKGCMISFIEVKTRLSDQYGSGREAVTLSKRHHIRKTAEYYLMINKKKYEKYNFEVIEVRIDHLENLTFE